MSEFDRARIRSERLAAKRSEPTERPVLTLPKQKEGRSNEIEVHVYINGEVYKSTFAARLTGNLMASQITEKQVRELVRQALSSKFTGVQ